MGKTQELLNAANYKWLQVLYFYVLDVFSVSRGRVFSDRLSKEILVQIKLSQSAILGDCVAKSHYYFFHVCKDKSSQKIFLYAREFTEV